MTSEPRDAPYPELKKTHTMAFKGRPWTDYKPPPAAPVWAAIEGLGRYYILLAALELDVFDTLQVTGPVTAEALGERLDVPVGQLATLLDGVVALGLLDQFVDVYELNDTAITHFNENPFCKSHDQNDSCNNNNNNNNGN